MIIERDADSKATHLGKVKSHIGIKGNEKADKAAVHMAKNWTYDVPYTTVDLGAHKHIPRFWPVQLTLNEQNQPVHLPLKDCKQHLRATLRPELQTYSSNTETIHYKALLKLHSSDWDQKISSIAYTSSTISFHTQKIIKKLLMGVYENQRRLHLFYPEIHHSPICILCYNRPPPNHNKHLDQGWNTTDGCGHIMGGCSHPLMKAMYIARHDGAVYIIAQSLLMSSKGAWLILADLGEAKRTHLTDLITTKHLEPGELLPSRIPHYLLPKLTADQRNQYRPDILLHRFHEETTAHHPTKIQKSKSTVVLIEVGYCRDTEFDTKRLAKEKQHTELREALIKEGWEVQYITIVLGNCGTVFKQDQQAIINTIGLSPKETKAMFTKLHHHAINMTSANAIKHTELRRQHLAHHNVACYPAKTRKPP
jgi:hypothetical protein